MVHAHHVARLLVSRLDFNFPFWDIHRRCSWLVRLDDAHPNTVACEWSDCIERVHKAPCAWRAGDPASLKVLGHLLEAPQAGGPGFGKGKVDSSFCIKYIF